MRFAPPAKAGYNIVMILLEFEKEALLSLEEEIDTLRKDESEKSADVLLRINQLQKLHDKTIVKLYSKLDGWQTCLVARHPERPQTKDYITALCKDFMELHGDRSFKDDPAIIAGVATFNARPVMVIGQQKGRGTRERLHHNFGMAGPEGYRKALRAMNVADKFRLPILCLVDTPGAYPGIGAEERGQSAAIGECLYRSATLSVPLVTVIIGEGGSGGALALAAGDYVGMLRYAVYSVISPEGCASILWKDATRMSEAAALLGITAPQLKKLNLVDEIISEEPGGAHRNYEKSTIAVGQALEKILIKLENMSNEARLKLRRRRWRQYGQYEEMSA